MGLFCKMLANGVLVDVVAAAFELFAVQDEMVGEASLPDREFGRETAREATFDVLDGLGEVAGSD